MKRLLILALLLASQNAHSAKLVSLKARSYLPVFGIGSTSSVVYTGAQGSVAAMTNNVGSATELVRVFTTTAAFIDIGTNPLPTVASMLIPANTEMILEIQSGHRIGAVDRLSGTGLLYVTRLITYPGND